MTSSSFVSFMLILHLLTLGFASGSYEQFRHRHGRAALAEDDAVSYMTRRSLFHHRATEIKAHNAQNKSWTMTINRYADYTTAELQAMLGYKRSGDRWSHGQSAVSGGSSFLQQQGVGFGTGGEELAKEIDWRNEMTKSATWVRNQGSCGSCWAVAAVGALEMHAEKQLQFAQKLSHQQLVDCVPNPRHCGGEGGCKGATAEQAFEYATKHGISTDSAYQSSDGECDAAAPTALKVSKFVRLPVNMGSQLLNAVATQGPVVVSVDGGAWFGYDSGVFSGCEQDTVVNHAVLATGYGVDPSSGKAYWTLRNSWGPDWGENGYLMLERHANDDDYCGVDNKPKEGVFCDDAPDTVPVCGMCGIASDSAYPVFSSSKSSALEVASSRARNGHHRFLL